MQCRLFAVLTLLHLVFYSTLLPKAFALSCMEQYSIIGTVSEITTQDQYARIRLDHVYLLSAKFIQTDPFSIDGYEKIVQEYVKNEYTLEHPLPVNDPPQGDDHKQISVPSKSIELSSLRTGDIVLRGPPMHTCNLGFTGVFSANGTIKAAITHDSYKAYSFRESILKTTPAHELKCIEYHTCKMAVDYQVGDESFQLSPGQSQQTTNSPIKAVHLLDSSIFQEKENELGATDWGLSTYVTQVLEFSDALSPNAVDPLEPAYPSTYMSELLIGLIAVLVGTFVVYSVTQIFRK